MNYEDYQKMTASQKHEIMTDSVKYLIMNLNRLRLVYDATPYTIEEETLSDGTIRRLMIKCPFDTLAWKLALLLEASTIMSVSVDGLYVYVE